MKITLMGTGAYSLGLALMLAKCKNNRVMLWSEDENKVEEFKQSHQIKSIFKDIIFPNNIEITNSYEEALKETQLIFLVTSVKYLKSTLEHILPFYHQESICIASKGIEEESLEVLSTVVKNKLHTTNIAVISGPSFAIDLVHNNPVALAIAGKKQVVNLVKDNLASETLKLRESSDIIGTQLCGCLKNIIAIASGILKGLSYSESTQAFLITESLHDIRKILKAFGGKKKTILSFAGVGDIILTCTSEKSRNYTYGYLLGKSQNEEEIKKYLKENTVEGYSNLLAIHKLLEKKGIDIPLINLLYDIVNLQKPASSLPQFLIAK